jgi:hypothetical protein
MDECRLLCEKTIKNKLDRYTNTKKYIITRKASGRNSIAIRRTAEISEHN